jgi:protein TonB
MGNVSCSETSKKKEEVAIMKSKSTSEQKQIDKTESSTNESLKNPINKYPPPPPSYDDGHEIYFIPPVADDDAVGIHDQQGDNYEVALSEAPKEERSSNERPEPQQTQLEIFSDPEEPAGFPGGHEAMNKFLRNNLVYPQTAIELNLQGKCYVQFTVNIDGSISNVKIKRGVPDCPECDKEAIRVVKSMPKWNPGKLNSKPVGSSINLPIIFKMI